MVRSTRPVAALVGALVTAMVGAAVVVAGGWSVPASAAYSAQAAPSWVPNGVVKAMVRSGPVVYLGGSFTRLTDPVSGAVMTRNRVAALDAVTGAPLPWNPNANGLVDAIAVAADRTVYLGGDFTAVGGSTATRLAAVTSAITTTDTGTEALTAPANRVPWTASANNTVHDLYVDGDTVYVAGRFGRVNGVNRPKLAQVTRAARSVLLTDFNPAVTGGRVLTLERAVNGSLLIGGDFTSVRGTPRPFVAAVTFGSGVLTGWNPGNVCATCNVWDLAATADAVYAAVGGPGGRAVRWDPPAAMDPTDTPAALRWSTSGDGNVQAVDVQAGVVYAGGHFGPGFGGTTRHQLAALDAGNGALQDYIVGFTGNDHPGIWALDADADGLRIAGGFVLAGNPAARYAALPLVAPVG